MKSFMNLEKGRKDVELAQQEGGNKNGSRENEHVNEDSQYLRRDVAQLRKRVVEIRKLSAEKFLNM